MLALLALCPKADAADPSPILSSILISTNTSPLSLHPGSIAAIVLGILFTPILLLVLGEMCNFRPLHRPGVRATLRAKLYRYTTIGSGVMLGLAIGIVLTPLFAFYMLAVFVAAVTASYGRYAGLDTVDWWQGQGVPDWTRLAGGGAERASTRSPSPPPTLTRVSTTKVKGGKYAYAPEENAVDAMVPLPAYPSPVYDRLIAAMVVLAVALPVSAAV